jgi:pseudouridine-5'-phosphate glycosidase
MPYPLNLGSAKGVEVIARTNGAVPATIAILDGIPCVGVYVELVLVLHIHICTLGELTIEEVLSTKSSVRQ